MSSNTCRNLCVLVALAALLVAPAALHAEHAWNNYHWARSSNPVTINHGDNVDPAKWGDRLAEAAADWDRSQVLNTPVVAGGANPKNCRPTDGMVEVCSDSYGNNGWLGIAQIWVSGDHITRGTARLNDYYHDNAPYNTYSWKQLVMCQEIGHTYGLTHQNEDFNTDETTSCMEYTSLPQGNESPDNHDYQQLEDIYAHLDGDGGGGDCNPRSPKCNANQPPPAFNMPLQALENWGRHVYTSPNGGQSVFVQDFGGGHKVVTHVTWTLEMAEQLAHGGHQH